MTYSKEQRKKFLMDYLDKLIDNIEVKPGIEGLIELRDALNTEILFYRDQKEARPFGELLLDLIK